LERGEVAIRVPPDVPKRHLVVSTPNVDVVVVGTIFDVSVIEEDGTPVTEVFVERGIVRLVRARDGRTITRLSAGESWSSRPVPPPESSAEVIEPELPLANAATPPAPASTLAEQNRLYRAALDARNAGDDKQAAWLLAQLLAKYPQTPLAQEARIERLRALKRLGRSQEATQAARSYLAEYGEEGFAQDEAREAALATDKEQRK
jgi:hypothetical protein